MMAALLPSEMSAQKVTYRSFDHYNERVEEFEKMRPVDSTDVVMLGNSLTELAGDWNKLLGGRHIRNRGIAGDDATGIYHRLSQILPGRPKAIFLMVGVNDISHDLTAAQVFEQCRSVIDRIRKELPPPSCMCRACCPSMNRSAGGRHWKERRRRWQPSRGSSGNIARPSGWNMSTSSATSTGTEPTRCGPN